MSHQVHAHHNWHATCGLCHTDDHAMTPNADAAPLEQVVLTMDPMKRLHGERLERSDVSGGECPRTPGDHSHLQTDIRGQEGLA